MMDKRGDDAKPKGSTMGVDSVSFLLAQVGAFAADRFAAHLQELGLMPAHAGLLRIIAASPGINQRALARRLQIVPARLVGLIDQMEQQAFVERRRNPDDRRNSALYLTEGGFAMIRRIGALAHGHEAEICAGLDENERAQLSALLQRVAEAHGLGRGVHPGYRSL